MGNYKLLLFATLFTTNFSNFALAISCINEKGTNVDWFINYKLPRLEDQGSTLVGQGLAYAYVVSNSKMDYFRLSSLSIGSPSSMVGRTLNQYYQQYKVSSLTYLFYNDEFPEDSKSALGHTKGVVLFDGKTGIWLVHSVPKFPDAFYYKYPPNGYANGQSFLCVSFNVNELNDIGKQLVFNSPGIYAYHLGDGVENLLDDDVKSLFTDKPVQIRSPPFSRTVILKSRRKLKLTSFAKDNQFGKDLYSALIAPTLDSDLLVETWRRGSGTPLDPVCDLKYQIEDVQIIGMDLTNKSSPLHIQFSYLEDHSKWAISQDKNSKWVCIGDINRMLSQAKRGGGSLCFQSLKAWKAFSSTIVETDECKGFSLY